MKKKTGLNNTNKDYYRSAIGLRKGAVDRGYLVRYFGCHNCHHRGTVTCPHGIGSKKYEKDQYNSSGELVHKAGDWKMRHSNGICQFRVEEVQELYHEYKMRPKDILEGQQILSMQNDLRVFQNELEMARKLRLDKDGVESTMSRKEMSLMNKIHDINSKLFEYAHTMRKHEEGSLVRHENIKDIRSVTLTLTEDDKKRLGIDKSLDGSEQKLIESGTGQKV